MEAGDLTALMKRIHAEAAGLRRLARKADTELETMAARARRKHREPMREVRDSRPTEGVGKLGANRQVGVKPSTDSN
jgi:hypothetical protein